jgi:hypothetical protein
MYYDDIIVPCDGNGYVMYDCGRDVMCDGIVLRDRDRIVLIDCGRIVLCDGGINVI